MIILPNAGAILTSAEFLFIFTNSVDPDEISMLLHFIGVFTVCKSTCLGVSRIQRDKNLSQNALTFWYLFHMSAAKVLS